MIGPRLPNGRFYGRQRKWKPLKSRTTRKAQTKPNILDTERIARTQARRQIYKNLESKTKDGALTTTLDWAGSTFRMLNDPSGAVPMSSGTGTGQYVGREIKVTAIRMRYSLLQADGINLLRILVIQTKGEYLATAATIFQSTLNARAPLVALDIRYNDRFSLLYDSGTIAVNEVSLPQIVRDVYISGRYIRKTTFTGTTGDAEDGDIYLVGISDSGVIANPTLQAYWRVYYKDG